MTNCTCNKGYTGPDGVACMVCIAGTYKDVNGSSPCSDCPSHAFSGVGSIAQVSCTCNKGYTGPDGAECEACEAGGFKDVNGSAACTLCAHGKYSPAAAAISEATCQGCPPHSYSGAGSGLMTNCTCNKGYTGPDGVACMACIAGTYKDVNGSSPCSLCSQGKYSTETGEISESTCSQCPAYTHSPDGSSMLTNCTCNKGYTGPDGIQCAACIAGTYKDVNGSAACALCPPGKFSASSGATICNDCPENTMSGVGSIMVTNCICNAGYTGPNGVACQACVAGKYKHANGSEPCSLCIQGKFSNVTGQSSETTCKDCPSDTYSGQGSSVLANCSCNKGYTGPDGLACVACAGGTYKDVNGSSPCALCSQGKYSAGTAQISEATCTACPAYTNSPDGSIVVTHCICNKGYTGPDGVECTSCDAGTYKDTNGTSLCILCGRDKYSTEAGAVSESNCLTCPANAYSGMGSFLATNCSCNVGHTGSDGELCTPCATGSYKAINGSSACLLCPKGKYSNETAQISNTTCVLCEAGKYLPTVGNGAEEDCILCPQGRITAEPGADSADLCSSCPIGQEKKPSLLCGDCDPGTYRSGLDMEACLPCPIGSFNFSNGSVTCSCLPGFVSAGAGYIPCSPCQAGSVNNVTRATTCSWCQPGKSSDAQNTTCIDCVPGTYSEPPFVPICKDCEANMYSDRSGSVSCIACPENTFTRDAEAWHLVNGTGEASFVWNKTTGASSCAACPVMFTEPRFYTTFTEIENPSQELCETEQFENFCSWNDSDVKLFVHGRHVVKDQEIPLGCVIDTRSVASHANRTMALCKACNDVAQLAGLAAAATTAAAVVVGAAAASGGANPALIDQIQFLSIVGTGISCHRA